MSRLPGAELLGKIPPGAAGMEDPENPAQNLPSMAAGPPSGEFIVRRKLTPDGVPLLGSEVVSIHPSLPVPPQPEEPEDAWT
jgi:hypothetical protein